MNDPGRVEELFHRCVPMSAEGRSAFLTDLAATEPVLARDLEELLDAHQRAGGNILLTEPIDAAFAAQAVHVAANTGPQHAHEMPERVGPFTIVSRIGVGGCGVVYLAERREPFHQQVAIKVIKPGMASPEVLERFEQERRALSIMNHPNIARVLDAGTNDTGQPYFVMEYVPGVTIVEHCARSNMPLRERVELFIPVCLAVQHAHSKGIIHRDLKPANILVTMLDGRPTPKVIDFGIAKALAGAGDQQTALTMQGQWIGTPEYMSPEQAAGGTLDLDTRSDVYSLGLVLYELLAGVPPFDRGELNRAGFDEIRRVIREVDPPRPSTRLRGAEPHSPATAALARELSGELEWIPLKAMRKRPEHRYATPIDIAADINNYLAGRALTAGPESSSYRAAKFVRRHRPWFIVAASLAAALIALAVVSETGRRREAALRLDAERAGAESAAAAVRERRNAYFAGISAANAALLIGDAASAKRYLADAPAELRGWEWRYLHGACDNSDATLAAPHPDPNGLLFSPDGQTIYTSGRDFTVRAWDVASKVETARIDMRPESDGVGIALSPDGRWLAAGGHSGVLKIIDTQSHAITRRFDACPIHGLALSPDGGRIAVACRFGDAGLRVYDFQTGAELWSSPNQKDGIAASMEFSSDGRTLYTQGPWVLCAFDADTGVKRHRMDFSYPLASALALSPDGRTLALGFQDGRTSLMDTETFEQTGELRGDGLVFDLDFVPGTDLLIQADLGSSLRVWDVASRRMKRRLFGHDEGELRVEVSPAGDEVAAVSRSGAIRLWRPDGPPSSIPLDPHRNMGLSFASHDGRLLASSDFYTSRVELWDMETRQHVRTFDCGVPGSDSLCFSPDNKRLFVGARKGGGIRVIDLATGEARHIPGYDGNGTKLFLSPDQRLMAVAMGGQFTRFIDMATEKFTEGPSSQVTGYAHLFSHDGRRLLCTFGTTFSWVDIATGEKSLSLEGHHMEFDYNAAALSPDGRRIITKGGPLLPFVLVWDADTGKLLHRLNIESNALSIMFFPDSSRILTSDIGGYIRFWDTETGAPVAAFRAGQSWANAIALPGRDTLVTKGEGEDELRLWTVTEP